ncbi:MAG TPA: stage V sporulation protein AC [Acholeplasmataceae bacterium]|nr:stage V sporulation protein AC [Acholeplasmataceae bacterium]
MNQKIEKVKQETEPKRRIWKNAFQAFISGGLICAIAQAFIDLFQKVFGLEKDLANNISVAIMVFLGALLTGLGIYDKIGQFAGAGSLIPITGFANSMTSSALESKSEGLIQGVITNMFKLAGSVIVVGVVSAFVVGTIVFVFKGLFG